MPYFAKRQQHSLFNPSESIIACTVTATTAKITSVYVTTPVWVWVWLSNWVSFCQFVKNITVQIVPALQWKLCLSWYPRTQKNPKVWKIPMIWLIKRLLALLDQRNCKRIKLDWNGTFEEWKTIKSLCKRLVQIHRQSSKRHWNFWKVDTSSIKTHWHDLYRNCTSTDKLGKIPIGYRLVPAWSQKYKKKRKNLLGSLQIMKAYETERLWKNHDWLIKIKETKSLEWTRCGGSSRS